MENYSLSDLAAITKDSDGVFGGAGGGIGLLIIIFLLLFAGGGLYGNNRNDAFSQFATASSQNEILLGQKFDALSRQINQVGDGLCSSTYALNNSILGEGRALQAQLSSCCCENQRNVDSVRFDMSNYASAIQANDTANTQKILDAISQNKIESLQGQINALNLQNAMAGVVRYPMASTYAMLNNPFCSCGGCGCAN